MPLCLIYIYMYLIILGDNACINEADPDNDKATIQTAVNAGNSEMTKYLLSTSSLTVTHQGDFVKQLVVSAVYSKSLSVLKCILDKYPELLQCEYQMTYRGGKTDKCSLLHHAAVAGSKEIVEFLVYSGLDMKQKTSKEERTVLSFAASNVHLNVVDYLLNINIANEILGLGADSIVSAGSVEIFCNMVYAGFNPLQRNKYGLTALHMALKKGNKELALYIIKQYPELIHVTGQYGRSALHFAAEGGSMTLLRYLIDMGEDTRYVDDHGETILHMACLCGQDDAVMYLTRHHKHLLHIKNNNGKTALHLTSVGGNVYIFKHLVSAGLDVHDRDNHMNNMLHYACYRRNHEMIEYLLQHYSDDMIQPTTKLGWYPFHCAAQFGDKAVFRLFVKHNVDICKLTSQGESILHISCRLANIVTTRFMLTQFPQLIPVKDNDGKTALEHAVRAGAVDIVKLFKKK